MALWAGLLLSLGVGSIAIQLVWLLALAGALLLIRGVLWQAVSIEARQWLMWWLLIMVPALLAMPDAVDPARAWRGLLRLSALALAGLALLYWRLPQQQHRRLLIAVAGGSLLLLIDGLVQAWLGRNVIGEPLFSDGRYALRVTGFLGVDYGWFIAVFSPMLLEGCRLIEPRGRLYWFAVPLLILLGLLSGSRASLMVMLVGITAFGAINARVTGWRFWRHLVGPLAVAVVAVSLALFVSETLRLRWLDALGLFSGSEARLNQALSLRPELWSLAWDLFQQHWFNGVGMRGFAAASLEATRDIDGLPFKPNGWSPHLTLLEIAVDLGVIGLVGYTLLCGWLLRWWWRAPELARAPALVALLALFPFGSTLSLFAPRVGTTIWLMLATALMLAAAERPGSGEIDACAA